MNSRVTIVLPVHNVERTLGRSLVRVLELAYSMGRRLQIALVDDGSTDGTFETACELSRQYPQVRVLRQPYQQGLGAALELVRRELGVEQVVAHDGVNAIDAEELSEVLSSPTSSASRTESQAANLLGGRRARRYVTPSAGIYERLSAVSSFRWLRLDEPAAPRRKRLTAAPLASAFDGIAARIGGRASAAAKQA